MALLLVTSARSSLMEHQRDDVRPAHLGRLIQPRHVSCIEQTDADGWPWAADNDCFRGFDHVAFEKMLDRIVPVAGWLPDRVGDTMRLVQPRHTTGCKFVAVPDVVGDFVATAHKFEVWAPAVQRRGLRAALVLQDGAEHGGRWLDIALACRVDAVFIGGTTEWKLGPYAAALAREAKRRGRWVHWGRVNSERRIRHVIATGACDSIDGTQWARFRSTYLDWGLDVIAKATTAQAIKDRTHMRLFA
jgi:hypothetical protein